LLARSRRGTLSAVEQRALDAHLAVCPLCEAARAFGALFDAIPDRPRAEDDVLAARLADRVAGRRAVTGPHRLKVFTAAAAVALVAAAGAAAAWVSVRRQPLPSAEAGRAPRPEPVGSAVAARAAAPAPASEPSLEAVAREEAGIEAAAARAPRRAPAPATSRTLARRRTRASAQPEPTPGATQPTAAELFAAANAARRARDLRGAIDRYLGLEQRFPDSEEALVARVSAGDLLSRVGEREAALQAFDRYLARRPDGALAPEALFGRARLLEALARRADESAAWQRLLRTFPGSVYEPAARRRLDELRR
jgi:TolA-binding protein